MNDISLSVDTHNPGCTAYGKQGFGHVSLVAILHNIKPAHERIFGTTRESQKSNNLVPQIKADIIFASSIRHRE